MRARVRLQHDMEELVSIGMTPLEAITAATATGADLLGHLGSHRACVRGTRGGSTGARPRSAEGFRVIYEPLVIVNNGEVVLNRYYPNPYDER